MEGEGRAACAAAPQMCLSGRAFGQCTACSATVVNKYREEGHVFLLKVRTKLSPPACCWHVGSQQMHASNARPLWCLL